MSAATNAAAPPPAAVAVVTVNWNGWRHTLGCLEALRLTRGAHWRLLIVDNGSSDDSLAHLSDLGDDVTLIRSAVNGGWTGGNNLGVAHALREGFDYIFLLNNDAFVEPDTLAGLIAAEGAHAGPRPILGAELRTPDNHLEPAALTRIDPVTGIPRWLSMQDAPVGGALVPTDSVCGAALFAHRSVYEAVGPFDDDLYLYFDETEWCLRAARAGFACWVAPGALVRHVGFSSTGGAGSPLFHYFMLRNQLLLAERYCSGAQRFRLARHLYWELRTEAQALGWRPWQFAYLFSGDERLRAMRGGLVDYLLRRFGDCPARIRRLNDAWRRKKA